MAFDGVPEVHRPPVAVLVSVVDTPVAPQMRVAPEMALGVLVPTYTCLVTVVELPQAEVAVNV